MNFLRLFLRACQLLAVLAMQPLHAQQVTCPKELKWADAIYLQRETHLDGHFGKAEVKMYLNASTVFIDFDGESGSLIALSDGLSLTSGAKQPKPGEFAEIGMAVEPPMWEFSDVKASRFPSPCSLENAVTMHFDESDFVPLLQNDRLPRWEFRGTMRREGLRIYYSTEEKKSASADRKAAKFQGILEYDPVLKKIPQETDVQGWHAYRANVYLMTFPIGIPISLASAHERLVRQGDGK